MFIGKLDCIKLLLCCVICSRKCLLCSAVNLVICACLALFKFHLAVLASLKLKCKVSLDFYSIIANHVLL